MNDTLSNQRELRTAFLAGSLEVWREAHSILAYPTRLILLHEAIEVFVVEIGTDFQKMSDSDRRCAKRYADTLVALQIPPTATMSTLIGLHQKIFDHQDGYRFSPGELKSLQVEKELETLLDDLGRESIDPFTNLHLLYTGFIKLSPFRTGNHVLANIFLHQTLMCLGFTKSPVLPLAKFVPSKEDITYDNFLNGLLHAQERVVAVYQSVRVLERYYQDIVATLETRPRKVAQDLLPLFLQREAFTVRDIETAHGKKFKITYHTLNKLMTRLAEDFHVLEILNSGERNRVFTLKGYSKLFAYYE